MRRSATVGVVAVVAVALLVGCTVLLLALRGSVREGIETAAQLRADDVVSLLESGRSPQLLAVEDAEDAAVQVLDRGGIVVGSSPNIAGRAPLVLLAPGEARDVEGLPLRAGGEFHVVARQTADGAFTVLVASSLEQIGESTRAVAAVLGVGAPLLLLLVGALTWGAVGRALRPVEAIRSEVESITGVALDRRVPVPPGQDEIALLARTMNAMLDRLEAARDRQRRFVADASHELRSPLATLRHRLEVAVAHPTSTTVEELVADLAQQELRMERLVEDLLLLARADEGAPLVARAVDLDDVVLEQVARLRRETAVAVDGSAISAARVHGDADALGRVVRNLLDNAARHARTRVTVSLGADGAVVRLVVDDDGAGIAAPDRQRVFERFTRLDEARARDDGGSGLGLALVADVAASHGGTVRIDEAPMGGARVVVELPAGSAPA